MAEQSRDSSVGDDSTDYVEDRDPKFDSPPISRSSTPETVIYDPESPAPLSRRRARSNSIRGEDANPANTPITASDQALANLIRSINSGRGPTEYRGVQSAPRFQIGKSQVFYSYITILQLLRADSLFRSIAGGHSPRPNRSSSGIGK